MCISCFIVIIIIVTLYFTILYWYQVGDWRVGSQQLAQIRYGANASNFYHLVCLETVIFLLLLLLVLT